MYQGKGKKWNAQHDNVKYISTRSSEIQTTLSEAVLQGLAADGGLFVPEMLPVFSMDDFDDLHSWKDIAVRMLTPFFEGDRLIGKLQNIVETAFSFPLPLTPFRENIEMLELFHGPTGAFKDVGARFLARCFEALGTERMVLVATSGDTGSAVASAFYGLQYTKVSVFFPKGKISPFQEHQLTCWDDNIYSFRVRADFDSCQKLVKDLFADHELNERFSFSSANSINIGRLLPQCTYYAFASLDFFRRKRIKPTIVVPTGNMGNALACIWAREMGFPISKIVLATNANDPIPIFFQTGKFTPKPSIQTLANAMDVGNPSNMERFLHLGNSQRIVAKSVSNEKITETIRMVWKKMGIVIDPHTATAVHCVPEEPAIIVSTAHPAKFKEIVEPIIERKVEIPVQLRAMLERSVYYKEIEPTKEDFLEKLLNYRD
ncbi:MAG: threonine synthase [Methanobacteriota archaeon]|nr:MAG: threonine synthase [Euryarchaeota archaeon]